MNLKQLEAALFAAGAAWLTANKSTVAADLAPLEKAGAQQLEQLAASVFSKVPVFGGIVTKALEGDNTQIVAALANGVSSFIDYLIAFCNGYAKALSA